MSNNGTSDVTRIQKIIKDFVKIKTRFSVLGQLQVGYKLWIKYDDEGSPEFEIDNSYIPSLSRWIYSQGRNEIINIITEDIKYINDYRIALTPEGRVKLLIQIEGVFPGLKNMRETYKGDQKQEEKLAECIDILESIANELKKIQ
jgi:hypothetical protein